MTDDEKQPIECHICPDNSSFTRVQDLINHVEQAHDYNSFEAQYLVREEWGIVRGKKINIGFDSWEEVKDSLEKLAVKYL